MHYIAVSIEVLHALVMAFWILGLPLLFWHRFPKLTIGYACYAVVFITINQICYYTLGECILTTIARWFWQHSGQHEPTEQWFSIKFAKLIFGLTPTHRAVKIAGQILIAICALGGFYSIYNKILFKTVKVKDVKST